MIGRRPLKSLRPLRKRLHSETKEPAQGGLIVRRAGRLPASTQGELHDLPLIGGLIFRLEIHLLAGHLNCVIKSKSSAVCARNVN